jgi:hypothetical protein
MHRQWIGEAGSVVGEDGVDPIGGGFYQAAREVRGRAVRHLLMQFDEGELEVRSIATRRWFFPSAVRT